MICDLSKILVEKEVVSEIHAELQQAPLRNAEAQEICFVARKKKRSLRRFWWRRLGGLRFFVGI